MGICLTVAMEARDRKLSTLSEPYSKKEKKKKGCPSPERLLPDSGFGLDRSYIRIHPSLALFNELFAISQDRETTLQFGSPSAFLFFFLKKKRTRKKATIPDGSRKQVESCVDSREHKFPIRV